MAFCSPSGVADKRLLLLKQAATTGMPARSKSRSHSASAARSNDANDVLKLPLAVDITTLPDDDPNEDANNDTDHPSPATGQTSSHIGYFTRRAFVAQGNYRTGWVLDEERAACAECRCSFGTMRRKHHCRGCGEVFCDFCTSQRSSVPHLEGTDHRVCRSCFIQLRRTTQDTLPSPSSSSAPRLPAGSTQPPASSPTLPPPSPLVEEDATAAASSNGSSARQQSAEVLSSEADSCGTSRATSKYDVSESDDAAGAS